MFTVPESPDLYLVIYVMVPALEQVTLIASDWRGRGAHCLADERSIVYRDRAGQVLCHEIMH